MSAAGVHIDMQAVVGRYGEHHAVGPVSGELEGPGVAWVTGGNGYGKTTLLRLLAGLKGPASGAVAWRRGAERLAARALTGRRGFLSPDVRLYEDLSALENLEFVAHCRGVARASSASREALADAGLLERGGERPSSFSSGQRQRLRLLAAWLGDPPFLFLDEPSSNLDESGSRWLWERVRERARTALCVVATNRREEVAAGEARIHLGGDGS